MLALKKARGLPSPQHHARSPAPAGPQSSGGNHLVPANLSALSYHAMNYEPSDRSLELPDSIAFLWTGSVSTAAPLCFMAGSSHTLNRFSQYLSGGELERGVVPALALPFVIAMFITVCGLVCLLCGFAISLRRDHRPLFSLPHFCALASLALPLFTVILIRK